MEKRSALAQEIITECDIEASAVKVYSIISDFPNFHKWSKGFYLAGDTRPGGKFSAMVNDPDGGWMKLKSKIIKMDEGIIVFDHVLYVRFIFSCKHRYEIIPISENKTRFINAEIFSGLAVPFVRKKKLLCNVRKFKDSFNAALKKTVEELAVSATH